MDEWKIDATLDALRLQYEQNKGFVVYRNAGRYFATSEAFEFWIYRLEQKLMDDADKEYHYRPDSIEQWHDIMDAHYERQD